MPSNTHNSLQKVLEECQILYNNAISFFAAISKSFTGEEDYIEFKQESISGGTETKIIPSYNSILNRVANMESTIDSLTEVSDGGLYAEIISKRDSIRSLVGVNYKNLPGVITNIDASSISEGAIVDNSKSILNNIYFPNVLSRIRLTDAVGSLTRRIEITKLIFTGATRENYTAALKEIEGLDYENIIVYLKSEGIPYTEQIFSRFIENAHIRYFGHFSALALTYNNNGTYTAKLDKLQYNDNNSPALLSKELAPGDKLLDAGGKAVYIIEDVSIPSRKVTVRRSLGTARPRPGADTFSYLDNIIEKYIEVEMGHGQAGLIFLSQIHPAHGTVNKKSPAIPFDTSKITINKDGSQYTIDEYLSANDGVGVGERLPGMMREAAPPANVSATPPPPDIANALTVVRVNEHLLQGRDVEKIKTLNAERVTLKLEIEDIQTLAYEITRAISSGDYKNDREKQRLRNRLVNKESERAAKEKILGGVLRQLAAEDLGSFTERTKGKYRIRGFIPEPATPAVDKNGNTLNIIRYRVHYKYLSKENNSTASKQFLQTDADGNEKIGTYSEWQEYLTPLRAKKLTPGGDPQWQNNNIENAEDINYTQINLPITANEKVAVRAKAILEAGYPNVLVESDWSPSVIIEFPDTLGSIEEYGDINKILKEDLTKTQFNEALSAKGLLEHIQHSYKENLIYIAHDSSQITSGFFTQERKALTVFDKLQSLDLHIKKINELLFNIKSTIGISVIDETTADETKAVDNGSIDLFAGYYLDNITESTDHGAIVSKQFYIKITNGGATGEQLFSILTGNTNDPIKSSTTKTSPYYDAPIGIYTDTLGQSLPSGRRQYHGQIAYIRKGNVTNNDELYSNEDIGNKGTIPPEHLIGSAAPDILTQDGSGGFDAVKLADGNQYDDFVALSTAYPPYQKYRTDASDTGSLAALLGKLNDAVAMFPCNTVKTDKQRSLGIDGDPVKAQYDKDDKYLIGRGTCGAFLTVNAINKEQIQVGANRSDSYKALDPGDANALIIPILFQYRMSDALGRVDGSGVTEGAGVDPLKYTKRIGVDILIFGKVFRFDIKIYALYKSSTADTKNLPAVSASALRNRLNNFGV